MSKTLRELIESNKEYTYKELCELLDIPKLNGYSKKKQLEELCEWEKNGTKYKLIREYTDLDREVIKASGDLMLPMMNQLYKNLSKTLNGVVVYSNDELMEALGIVNIDNKYIRHSDYEDLKDLIDLEGEYRDLDLYSKIASEFIINSLRRALERLNKHAGFDVNTKAFRLHRFRNGKYERLDVAPESELHKKILDIRYKALKDCGYTSGNYEAFMYYGNAKLKEYYINRCNYYCSDILGWDKFTNVIRITFGADALRCTKEYTENKLKQYYNKKVNGCKSIDVEFWEDDEGNFRIDLEEYYRLITDKSCPLKIAKRV